jgi:hypothetical protein
MSNLLLVNDALTLINVLPVGVDASAEDGALALRVVGEMVDEWADDGLLVNWNPQARLNEETQLVGTELTAVKYQLAVRLCPYFSKEPSPVLIGLAASALQKLQRQQLARGEGIKLSMPEPEARGLSADVTR